MTGRPAPPARSASRRGLLAGTAAACLLGVAAGSARPQGWALTNTGARARATDPRAITTVPTDAPLVALTFDDGPDPDYTPTVLDILARSEVRATFFMIGRSASRHPDLVARVLAEGHAVANHTADHLWLDRLDAQAVRDQIERGDQMLRAVGGVTPGYFRPPRGQTSPTVSAVTGSLATHSFFWDTCLEANLRNRSDRSAARRTADRCQPGAIILAHDGGHLDGPNPQSIDRSRTVAALPHLIEAIRADGLGFATLPRLMADAHD